MNKCFLVVLACLLMACSQFNKGITDKKELRSKKPPSVKIAEGYDKQNKRRSKVYTNPKKAAKMREKQSMKMKQRGDKYLKKRKKKAAKNQ
ncbi:MAG: hypothetical protein RIE58_10435 [Vicingaceae bacterium]